MILMKHGCNITEKSQSNTKNHKVMCLHALLMYFTRTKRKIVKFPIVMIVYRLHFVIFI